VDTSKFKKKNVKTGKSRRNAREKIHGTQGAHTISPFFDKILENLQFLFFHFAIAHTSWFLRSPGTLNPFVVRHKERPTTTNTPLRIIKLVSISHLSV
jgi:hypothetical protein